MPDEKGSERRLGRGTLFAFFEMDIFPNIDRGWLALMQGQRTDIETVT